MAGEMGSGSSSMESSGSVELGGQSVEYGDQPGFEGDGASQEMSDNGYQEAYERSNDSTELPGNEADYNQDNSDYQRAYEANGSQEAAESRETSKQDQDYDYSEYEKAYGDEASGQTEQAEMHEHDPSAEELQKQNSSTSVGPVRSLEAPGQNTSFEAEFNSTEADQQSYETTTESEPQQKVDAEQHGADPEEASAERADSRDPSEGDTKPQNSAHEEPNEANCLEEHEETCAAEERDAFPSIQESESVADGEVEDRQSQDVEASAGISETEAQHDISANDAEAVSDEPSDGEGQDAFRAIDSDDLDTDRPSVAAVEKDAFQPLAENDGLTLKQGDDSNLLASDGIAESTGIVTEYTSAQTDGEAIRETNIRPFEKESYFAEEASENYKTVLSECYDNMHPDVASMYSAYNDKLSIAEYNCPSGTAWYSPSENMVHLNQRDDLSNSLGAGNTYFHECAHQIDQIKGWEMGSSKPYSYEMGFADAIKADYEDAVDRIMAKEGCSADRAKILLGDELYCAGDSANCVSDLFGGLSGGVAQGAWGHESSYWQGADRDIKLSTEAFAEISADYACGASDHLKLTKQYMPRTYKLYAESLRKDR